MKLIYHNETKRIQMPQSYSELYKISHDAFNLSNLPTMKFYYVDCDKDIISISTEKDFTEALKEYPPISRLYVSENIDQAKESIRATDIQRSEVLSQSMSIHQSVYQNMQQSFMSRYGDQLLSQSINMSEYGVPGPIPQYQISL